MDVALSSSTVLGAAVLVWLLWVAPYLMRRRRSARAAGEASLLMDSADVDPIDDGASAPAGHSAATGGGSPGRPSAEAGPKSQAASAASSDQSDPKVPSAPMPPRLRIRWGRLGVALGGLAALLATAVTLALMLLGVPGWIPAVCAAAAVGSVAILRTLALRDRKRRVDDAFREAMTANAVDPSPPPSPRVPAEVFDAGREPEPAPRAMSREELRAIALEVAKASQATADEAAKASGEGEAAWDPVEVPKPSYLEAAKAERPEPAPLEVPADPQPQGHPTLKPRAEGPEPGTVPGVPALAPRPAGRAGALGNLDEVLQRRRA
ncbi:hypothetical protein RBS60_13225 [Sinomonas sp. ASV486]|uniref:hypothetical protein n=1 Tax=Sinomonas sp. ASV486 TaxID=3051170 RepID=UPI0027DDA4AE|nr:hypothetical protein [Sinomonas sp. ASV486]MDQ4491158.1 hypothetical protein [Sinomonas sp. ASV486]